MQFTLDVTGYSDDMTAVYPTRIGADAPPDMLGRAVGEYAESPLGTTAAGTRLSVWSLPGGEADALTGTVNLRGVFDFLERTYGPYAYGDHAGSVSIDWDDIGGMEHHPYWHIASNSMRSEEVHAHEAAHGWFGDAVRFACWEDFVLSEGTTTYIAGRALESLGGPDLFLTYAAELEHICNPDTGVNTPALLDTCEEIDILVAPLWSMVPYMKGACFYEDVGDLIGPEALDEVIASFYQEHMGKAATMRKMIDAIEERVEGDQAAALDALVVDWLTGLECPTNYRERCQQYGN